MSKVKSNSTIALMLGKRFREAPLETIDDKYIQALYLLKHLNYDVVIKVELNENEKKYTDRTEWLMNPIFAYRLLEINNYVYLPSISKWEKVTEPTQLELELK